MLIMSSLSLLAFVLASLPNPWLKVLGYCLFTGQIWAWFSIFHSCGHNAYFKNRRANDAAGMAISVLVGVPYFSWKIHHASHHKWTGYKDMDPTAIDVELPPKDKLKFFNLMWKLWIPFISASHVATHLWNPKSVWPLAKRSKALKRKVAFSFALIPAAHLMLIATVGFKFYAPWLVAMGFFLFTSDIVLLSQHAMLPMLSSEEGARPLAPELHAEFTRSISFGKLVDRYILLNFGEHSKHHRHPLRAHFELDEVTVENEQKVNGWQWIKTVKACHIRDALSAPEKSRVGA